MKQSYHLLPIFLVNSVPIFGVLFFEWNLFNTVFLFWLESGVIGFYNIVKLVKYGKLIGIFYSLFFIGHFGIFMVTLLFGLMSAFKQEVLHMSYFALPLIVLLASYGFSFFRETMNNLNLMDQMFTPYKRIIVMQVAVVFGGLLVSVFKEPLLGLILLILAKLVVDIFLTKSILVKE